MDTTYHKKRLVIDSSQFLEMENLQRKVNPAVKHPEPILRMDAPWETENDLFGYMNVLYDEDEGIFKMWYASIYYDGSFSNSTHKLAYATSPDGINWEKPQLGIVEVNGSKNNNCILPGINVVPSIIKDPSDIPERRYKMIFTSQGKEMVWAEFHSPLCLAYSADGINWERPVHVNPVLRGVGDDCFSLVYDADRRKYLLFTRRVPNLPRDISLYESYDLVNWEDKGRVLVAGDEHDPPEMYNFYYMTPFRYEDFFLSMLNTQWTSPISESYDSYHRSPNHPDTKMGRVDIQLAYSRDGRNWCRPQDRTPVIAWDQEGSSEEGGVVYTAQNPIVKDGETWIYYRAQSWRHSLWHIAQCWERDKSVRNTASGCLAKMPEDRWVCLEAANTEGWLLTKPLGIGRLLVNADAKGGAIWAEPLTPFGEPIKGLTRAECIPVTGNGKNQEIKWKNATASWDMNEAYKGGVCWKIYLQNAKLYSYTIPEPDPIGNISRRWANARWREIIKHRSDNWGRMSTEPAIGLPPPSGPGPEKGQEKPGRMELDF